MSCMEQISISTARPASGTAVATSACSGTACTIISSAGTCAITPSSRAGAITCAAGTWTAGTTVIAGISTHGARVTILASHPFVSQMLGIAAVVDWRRVVNGAFTRLSLRRCQRGVLVAYPRALAAGASGGGGLRKNRG